MSRIVRLALVQMDAVLGDVEANVGRALGYVQQAGQQSADVVVFPELFSTGYRADLLGARLFELAEPVPGPTTERLGAAAHQANVHVIAPIAVQDGSSEVIHDSAVAINRRGQVVGVFHKLHLFGVERGIFQPGAACPTFATDFGRFGILICYDGGFPEIARLLALGGAEVIFAPCAFRKPDRMMWDIYWPARALENSLFVAATNRVGREGDLHLFGANTVADPRGQVIVQAPEDVEQMLVVDVDLDQVQATRAEICYLRDRRPEIYQGLTSKVSVEERVYEAHA